MDKQMRFKISLDEVKEAQVPSEVKLAYEIAREMAALDKELEFEADGRGLLVWLPENGIITSTFIRYMERVVNYYHKSYYISTEYNSAQLYIRVTE